MDKKDIIDAWARLRETDQSVPDEVLDFMKEAALEKLLNSKIGYLIGKDLKGQSFIHCYTCGRTSYNLNDINYRFCGYCEKFHHPKIV